MPDLLYSSKDWIIRSETASLPDGRTKTAEIAKRPDSVHIIAFTDEGKVLILKEYRAFLGTWTWVIPSGRIDKESDKLVAAQRELQEETGFRAASMEPYFSMRASETLLWTQYVFIAKGLTPDPLPQDHDEMIEVHAMSIDEALDKMLSAEPVFMTAASLALLRYRKEYPNG